MARLPYLDADQLPAEDRDVLARPINLSRLLAHSPNAARALVGLGSWIRGNSAIDPRLRELALIQIGYSAANAYEYSHHIKIGFQCGVSESDLAMVAADNLDGLPRLDAAVLAAARELVRSDRIGAETFEVLRDELGNNVLVDLVVAITHYIAIVRLLASFEVDVEPEYADILERFPLP